MAAQVRCVNEFSNALVASGIASIVGSLGALVANEIQPTDMMHGACFAVVGALVGKVTRPIFERIFAQAGATVTSKIVGYVLNIALGIAASVAFCGFLGIQFSPGVIAILAFYQLTARIISELMCEL